ncbi:MAG TPA: hypothetical protein VMJ73_01140 [Rhizomicrobium sp.]|nr:hypothetical protein [Rhizomicrobium sp.]
MSEPVFFATIGLILVTILVVFGMKYLSAARQAQVRITGEAEYRDIAAKAVAVQTQNGAALSVIQTELAQIGSRLAAVEKILKAVE